MGGTPPMTSVILLLTIKNIYLSAYPTPNTDYQRLTVILSANYPQFIRK